MPRPMEKLRDLGPQELVARERELTDQVFRLRFQMNTGQSEGLKKLRLARRDLARVKTLLREDQLKLQRPATPPKTRLVARPVAQPAAPHTEDAATATKSSASPKAKPANAKSKGAKPKGEKLKGAAPKSKKSSTKSRTSHGK
jgi:large subunit ribosomal protein L29